MHFHFGTGLHSVAVTDDVPEYNPGMRQKKLFFQMIISKYRQIILLRSRLLNAKKR